MAMSKGQLAQLARIIQAVGGMPYEKDRLSLLERGIVEDAWARSANLWRNLDELGDTDPRMAVRAVAADLYRDRLDANQVEPKASLRSTAPL